MFHNTTNTLIYIYIYIYTIRWTMSYICKFPKYVVNDMNQTKSDAFIME